MNDVSKMPFGPYKDIELGRVPGKYLVKLKKDGKAKGALLEYIINNEPILHHKNRN